MYNDRQHYLNMTDDDLEKALKEIILSMAEKISQASFEIGNYYFILSACAEREGGEKIVESAYDRAWMQSKTMGTRIIADMFSGEDRMGSKRGDFAYYLQCCTSEDLAKELKISTVITDYFPEELWKAYMIEMEYIRRRSGNTTGGFDDFYQGLGETAARYEADSYCRRTDRGEFKSFWWGVSEPSRLTRLRDKEYKVQLLVCENGNRRVQISERLEKGKHRVKYQLETFVAWKSLYFLFAIPEELTEEWLEDHGFREIEYLGS